MCLKIYQLAKWKENYEFDGMQKGKMKKIEEHTLYIIDLKKEIDILKVNNEKKNWVRIYFIIFFLF